MARITLLVVFAGVAAPTNAITVLWQSPDTDIYFGLTFGEVEFENPLVGGEAIVGYRIIEWRDADYAAGPPRWYDDWIVNNPADIDGNANEIWMRSSGDSISTSTTIASDHVSIHLNGDSNDGLAQVLVDNVEVARLDMYSAPSSDRAVIVVEHLAVTTHTITVNAQGAGVGGDDVATLGAAVLQPDEIVKWEQPPEEIGPSLFFGWDEMSLYGGPQIAADDWICTTDQPVSKIRWWGSFIGWTETTPPPPLPARFHFAIWTDVPPMPPMFFSHPGVVLWTAESDAYSCTFVGFDQDPRQPGIPEACFLFECDLPESAWFRQDQGTNIYWLSIAAEQVVCSADFDHDGDVDAADLAFFMDCFTNPHPGCEQADLNGDRLVDLADLLIMQCQLGAGWPDPACCPAAALPPYPWGWKTRPHQATNPDDAVRILSPTLPAPGLLYEIGEPVFWPDPSQSWDLAFTLISEPVQPVRQACCLPDGSCQLLTYAECMQQGGDPRGPGSSCLNGEICNPIKWSQPPMYNPASPDPECFYGWDERSHYMCCQIVADDWPCTTDRPITDIHWWGSYQNWIDPLPPSDAPDLFHIGIWTNVPVGPTDPFSHPGVMLWQWIVPRGALNERAVGCDWHPLYPSRDTTFRYDFYVPQPEWFYQGPGEQIFWVSISAWYQAASPVFPWGWKTREHYFMDDAVVILAPPAPLPGMLYEMGYPIETPDGASWDMAFVITTERTGACCVGWACRVISAQECAQLAGRYLGDGTNCGPPNPCEIRDVVVCEPQLPPGNPSHPPTYWYDVTPVPGFGRCDFHVKVADPLAANYTNVVAPPTWQFAVHQVGADWWASWWDPDCDSAIFATFRFQFTHRGASTWGDWTTTISATDDPNAQWIDRSQNHTGEPDGLGYRVHVPQPPVFTEACCLPNGSCIDIDPIDCILLHGGIPGGPGTRCGALPVPCDYAKWSQPPTANPAGPERTFWGWNELSVYTGAQIVGDDWLCVDERKVRDIHWWGSYLHWTDPAPPAVAPTAFHIGIWSDVPASPGGDPPWSHPGMLLWDIRVPRNVLSERAVGVDFHPEHGFEACYQYDLRLPADLFFQQNPSVETVHWITIAALYEPLCDADFDDDGDVDFGDVMMINNSCLLPEPLPFCWRMDLNGDGVVDVDDQSIADCQRLVGWPDPACCGLIQPPTNLWGWKTRRPHWNDDAIRILRPTAPIPGYTMEFVEGFPIENPEGSWDMAFVLTTNRPPCPSVRGDCNCDGVIDFFDIDPFLLALFTPQQYQLAYCNGDFCTVDANCDEVVDFFDIDPFLVCLFSGCPPCP